MLVSTIQRLGNLFSSSSLNRTGLPKWNIIKKSQGWWWLLVPRAEILCHYSPATQGLHGGPRLTRHSCWSCWCPSPDSWRMLREDRPASVNDFLRVCWWSRDSNNHSTTAQRSSIWRPWRALGIEWQLDDNCFGLLRSTCTSSICNRRKVSFERNLVVCFELLIVTVVQSTQILLLASSCMCCSISAVLLCMITNSPTCTCCEFYIGTTHGERVDCFIQQYWLSLLLLLHTVYWLHLCAPLFGRVRNQNLHYWLNQKKPEIVRRWGVSFLSSDHEWLHKRCLQVCIEIE